MAKALLTNGKEVKLLEARETAKGQVYFLTTVGERVFPEQIIRYEAITA
jgi:hypothetical protein